jgi:flavin reductase (DIM6/NTAB) family NADH-FMN oxidoreductase RutF
VHPERRWTGPGGKGLGTIDEAAERALNHLVGRLDYPMAIATVRAGDDGELAGCLVGFMTQSSLRPLRYLVCLSRQNHTYEVAQRAPTLALHFPTPGELELAVLFGEQTGDDVDKFARCDWRPGPGGAPLLSGCGTWLAGPVLDRVDLGDHVGHLLDPVAAAAEPGFRQLGFQAVRTMPPGHPA